MIRLSVLCFVSLSILLTTTIGAHGVQVVGRSNRPGPTIF